MVVFGGGLIFISELLPVMARLSAMISTSSPE
jgi:hypothetical protein